MSEIMGVTRRQARNDDLPVETACGPIMMSGELAMAYVPCQQWESPYAPDVGFARGTIFPCLDKPFIGEEAVCHG